MFIKKLAAALLAALILIAPAVPRKTYAAAKYGRAITENVGFYKNPDATGLLFYLPYTYYVRITEEGAAVSRAELFYAGGATPVIDGYVYTDTLYYESAEPVSPFYELTLTTASTAPFYADSACVNVLRYIFENRKLSCYGSVPGTGGVMYFVEYNGQLGYVKEENVMPFTFTKHPTPLPEPEIPDDPVPEEPAKTGKSGLSKGLKIAVIVAVSLAALTILAYALKPEKKHKEAAFYDDNDYD